MSQFFYVHPDNPQKRLISQACELIREGAVVVYPTDSGYAIGCQMEDKKALEQTVSGLELSLGQASPCFCLFCVCCWRRILRSPS